MPVVTAHAEPLKPQAPIEAPVQEEVKKPEEELSPKFAMLARKEKSLRAQAQAIKAREDAFKVQEAEYSTKYIPKERLLKETLAVLNEQGITYDQLTGMILNQPGPQELANQKLEAKIADLESKLNKNVETAQEEKTKAYEQAVNQIRNEAKVLIDSDPSFETIKETNNVEAVVALIEETYKEDKIILSTLDAAKQVEEYLIEEAMKMVSLKKVKEKLTPQEEVKKQITAQPQLKTLTNAVSASSTKPLSSKERAILAFKGQLK